MLLQYATLILSFSAIGCSVLFFYCHKFTVFILILILSTTAELLICGKALPRINMITSMPSPTIFLSALINLTYTYFGLTFSLIGQESTEEFLGARIMPYYSKEKKGAISIRSVISWKRHIIKTWPSCRNTASAFVSILNSFLKCMYFCIKTLMKGYFFSFCSEIWPTLILGWFKNCQLKLYWWLTFLYEDWNCWTRSRLVGCFHSCRWFEQTVRKNMPETPACRCKLVFILILIT